MLTGIRQYLKALVRASTFFLFFSVALLYLFVDQLMELNYNSRKLIEHRGVVEKKYIEKEFIGNHNEDSRRDSVDAIRIKLYGRPEIYSVTGRIVYYDYAIQVGDTVKLYTKPITSVFGNYVAGGSSTWTTHDPNYIYHLISEKDHSVIINFDMYKENLANTIWIFGGFGIGLFILYLFSRRSGRSSAAEEDIYR
jgi:hypothetical protein